MFSHEGKGREIGRAREIRSFDHCTMLLLYMSVSMEMYR